MWTCVGRQIMTWGRYEASGGLADNECVGDERECGGTESVDAAWEGLKRRGNCVGNLGRRG